MRVTKDAEGKFIIEEEPFVIEGEAAKIFRAKVTLNSTPATEQEIRDLEDCVRLYAEAWSKRAS